MAFFSYRNHNAGMRRRAWMAVALLAAVVAVWMFSRRPREQSYQGRSLASWLADLDDGQGGRGISWSPGPPQRPSEKEIKAREAIQQFGPQVLPELMKHLRVRESLLHSFTEWLGGLWYRLGQRRAFPVQTPMNTAATETRHRAALAIIALEPMAEPSVTELSRLFQDSAFSKDAGLVLASLGPRGLPPLLTAVSNTPAGWQSLVALWALGHFPSNAEAAVPFAAVGITNRDLGLKYASVWLLMRVHSRPDIAIAALTNGLADSRINDYCLTALESYGSQATSAVPYLLTQLNAPGRSREVGQALKAIDPEAAAKAGVK